MGGENITYYFCKKVPEAGKWAPSDRSHQLANRRTLTTPLFRRQVYEEIPQLRTSNSAPQRLNIGTNMFIQHINFVSAAGRLAVYSIGDWPKEGNHCSDDAEIKVTWTVSPFATPHSQALERALRALGCSKRTLQKKTY